MAGLLSYTNKPVALTGLCHEGGRNTPVVQGSETREADVQGDAPLPEMSDN